MCVCALLNDSEWSMAKNRDQADSVHGTQIKRPISNHKSIEWLRISKSIYNKKCDTHSQIWQNGITNRWHFYNVIRPCLLWLINTRNELAKLGFLCGFISVSYFLLSQLSFLWGHFKHITELFTHSRKLLKNHLKRQDKNILGDEMFRHFFLKRTLNYTYTSDLEWLYEFFKNSTILI